MPTRSPGPDTTMSTNSSPSGPKREPRIAPSARMKIAFAGSPTRRMYVPRGMRCQRMRAAQSDSRSRGRLRRDTTRRAPPRGRSGSPGQPDSNDVALRSPCDLGRGGWRISPAGEPRPRYHALPPCTSEVTPSLGALSDKVRHLCRIRLRESSRAMLPLALRLSSSSALPSRH